MSRQVLQWATMVLMASSLLTPVSANDERQFARAMAAYDSGRCGETYRAFRPLARRGDLSEQFNLGMMYGNGRGVPQSELESLRWYRMAADQGHAGARTNLGGMYFRGDGVPTNDVETYVWFSIGSANGNVDSRNNLSVVERRMTGDQMAEAQRIAAQRHREIESRTGREEDQRRAEEEMRREEVARRNALARAYVAEVAATVERRWQMPKGASASDEAFVLTRINPETGLVLSFDVQQCDGSTAFCESVRQTMERLQSLPRPPDEGMVRGGIRIRFSPE